MPEGAGRLAGDRIPNKNPIRFGRTGLDAVTRLRVEELRFRKGQDTNVHRFVVAGGGPFLTVRCRDRLTHSIPQESSAGRNLITVFCHVNNPKDFFSGGGSEPVIDPDRDRRPRATTTIQTNRRDLLLRFRKAHKKRHLRIASRAPTRRVRCAACDR
ncbi:hypothetical protein ACFPN1_08140 [Lysobacter yangpyeongensis]|uniref:Uncharacterized protein n=1 Tax=Lysobacter yangpyeongensis TaxID=346182 RepID=A0ABW0SM21_9GAMM